MRFIVASLSVLLFCACSREDDAAPVTELPFFFIGTVNSQTIGFASGSTQGLDYQNEAYQFIEQFAPDSFHVYEGSAVFDGSNTTGGRATAGLMAVLDHSPDINERSGIYRTGFHRYALGDSLGQGGAFVNFVDGNGVAWTTLNHAQSDTSFRIELITPVAAADATAVFQARFSCRLFNAAGDSINLENGSLRGKILKP